MLNWGGPPLGVQILYTFPIQKWASNKLNRSDIILRILRFLAESSGTKLELFQSFPHCKYSGSPNERDQNMSCFEGLEMGLNLEVLRPEVDALGRWSRSYRYQKPARFCALVAQRGARNWLSPAKINEQDLPKAMFLKEVTLNQEAVHN